ncbi:MAG: hypothetical protein E4H39_02500 [Syntrophobacterales bacterium]|nr:MAG: hypothetical protein E4H39_02500 [Syntrophobacterales bacterium]
MTGHEYNIAHFSFDEREFSIENPYLTEISEILDALKTKKVPNLSVALSEYRPELITKYAFSIPVMETLEIIAGYSPLVEIGAGTGYWAMCLAEAGAEIEAFDIKPPDENTPYDWFDTNYWFGDTWYTVGEGDESMAAACPEMALFLSWPMPESPMAYNALQHYKGAGGHTVIYIGDARSSGDERFHDELLSLTIVENRRIWSWPGVEERLIIGKC